jgi:hypothetical protein
MKEKISNWFHKVVYSQAGLALRNMLIRHPDEFKMRDKYSEYVGVHQKTGLQLWIGNGPLSFDFYFPESDSLRGPCSHLGLVERFILYYKLKRIIKKNSNNIRISEIARKLECDCHD